MSPAPIVFTNHCVHRTIETVLHCTYVQMEMLLQHLLHQGLLNLVLVGSRKLMQTAGISLIKLVHGTLFFVSLLY